MNKKVAVIIAVLLLLLIGGGAFYAMKKSPSANSNSQVIPTIASTNTTNKTEMMQGTFKNLLSQGKSVKCTYSNNTQGASISGTVYVADGKLRGDFTSTASKTAVNGHMLVDSSYSYVWTDMSNQGMKFPITSQQANPSTNANVHAPDINQSLNYSCQNWSADSSVFVLPSNITFSTFTLPSGVPTAGTGSYGTNGSNPSSQCAACDSVPAGPGRDACKAQLHCQ